MMVDTFLFIPAIVSFLVTIFLMPLWINKAKQIGLLWDDVNKFNSEKVAGSGGIVVMLSFIIGMSLFIAYRVFILDNSSYLIEILAISLVLLILGIVGFIDDLFGWQRGGLSVKSRIIMCFIAAIPLMAINAGKSLVSLPLIGFVDFGIIYPLILIPIAIIGTSTTFNFLAGFNGLEAGQGILTLSALGIVAFLTGQSWLSVVALIMVVSLAGFLLFNFSPARVFPGDVLTYPVGGLIAVLAILGNFEKIALFFFIPFIIEVILKSRGKLKKSSFGKPNKDGSLSLRHDRIYGLTHLTIYVLQKLNIKPTEVKVTLILWAFNILVVILGFLLFII